MTDGYHLAIDFGTSNTCATTRRPGQPPSALRLGYSTNAMPSAVLLQGADILVGDDATRLAALDPGAFERTPKRRLGQPSILLGGREIDPRDLVAAVFRRVLHQATLQSQGAEPSAVAITHPAAWSGHLTDRLLAAASAAGIDPGRTTLLPEPLAAAWRHAADGGVAVDEQLAVVDFGGGTFDAAHLQVNPGPNGLDIRVGRTDGLDPLGGDDFDGLLEMWVRGQLRADGRDAVLAALDGPKALGARLTLRDEVTKAKHALSHHPSAPIVVAAGDERAVVTVTAAELEAMIAPSVDRAVETTRRLLDGAEVDHLFLTGGTSLIPLVQRKFQALSGGRVGTLGDPKEVTSQGALLATPAPPPMAPQPPPPVQPPPPPFQPQPLPPQSPARQPRPPEVAVPVPDGPGRGNPGDQHGGGASATDQRVAGKDSKGRRTLVVAAAVIGAVVLFTVLAMVVSSLGRGSAGAVGSADGATTATQPQTSATTTTSASGTTSASTDCTGLDTRQCDLVTSRASLIVPGSCSPWEGAPERHAVKCTPKRTAVAITGAPTLYLYQYAAAADMRADARSFFSSKGVDLATLQNTDLDAPPAKDTWKFTEGTAQGSIYTHFASDENMARLMWTYDSAGVFATLASTGGNVPNLVKWWESS